MNDRHPLRRKELRNSDKQLMDNQLIGDWTETELLDIISGPDKIGTKISTLNETTSSYGVNPMPVEQFLSPRPGEYRNTAHIKQKRKAPETARDREKKREIDKAYRQRCKEKKKKTEQDVAERTEENKKLKREIDHFKNEVVKQREMVQAAKEKMKLQQNELGQLKAQLLRQNLVVDVLSEQVAGSNDKDLQRENAQLKNHINVLTKKMNNPENLNGIHLRAKIAQLENEKHSLQVIVDALCEKINNEKDQLGTQELA